MQQLKTAGIISNDGKVGRAVMFNGPNGEVNANGQRIINVGTAVEGTDAVNLAQLEGTGLAFAPDGRSLNRSVTYLAESEQNGQSRVQLAPNTLLSNVAAGLADTDATNLAQVKGLVSAASEQAVTLSVPSPSTPGPRGRSGSQLLSGDDASVQNITANGGSGINAEGQIIAYNASNHYTKVNGPR